MRRRSAGTPEIILEAAEALIRREGAARLTLDAVAAEAGLSKGGVMHHFASKDALIDGMVRHQLARMKGEMAEIESTLPPSRIAPLLALARHARAHYGREDAGIPKALLAAATESPRALAGFRAEIAETLSEIEGHRLPGPPSVLFFAVLGLMLTEGLGFFSYDTAEATALLDALEGMAELAEPAARG